MFTDAHAHLDAHYFDEPVGDVLARAAEAGVSRVIVVGCGVEASRQAVRLAKENPGRLFASVGVHPHDSGEMSPGDFEAIRGLAELPEVVAIGETGLDYHYDRSPREVQREVFFRFLELAVSVRKPLIVHTREAEQDTISILRETGSLPASGQLHCFTGTPELADAAIDMGMYVSFSGVLTFPGAGSLRELARRLPADRLLIETDCPYMTPAPFRGRKNEPMLVPLVAGTLAAERDVSVEKIAEQTSGNASVLFKLPPHSGMAPVAFASGSDLYVNVGDEGAFVERIEEAVRRYPRKKIRRLVPYLASGAVPSAPLVDLCRRLAAEMGRSFAEELLQ